MAISRVMEPVSPTYPEPLRFRLAARVLCLLVLLYIPVQWVAGRHPGSTSIFSSQDRQLAKEFLQMHDVLRQQLLFQCEEHGVRDIFFSADDVATPYLANQVPAGCAFHRPTDVTPIARTRELSCSALIVDESLPNAWNLIHRWGDPGPNAGNLLLLSEWKSDKGQFGFRLLQVRGCHTDAGAERL